MTALEQARQARQTGPGPMRRESVLHYTANGYLHFNGYKHPLGAGAFRTYNVNPDSLGAGGYGALRSMATR